MEQIKAGLRRLLVDNPSPLTGTGTQTYILGTQSVAVIDPGPQDARHLEALLTGLGGARVEAILVTHAHLDHSPLSRDLAKATGAPIYGFGPPEAGRSAAMQALAARGDMGGGEGTDHAFVPDVTLSDGEAIIGTGWHARALWTPGHFSNHLSFLTDHGVFCGDLVMAWASTLISPPDGDLTAFRSSCKKLLALADCPYFPTHGEAISSGHSRLREMLAHRQAREDQILNVLRHGPARPDALVAQIYTDVAQHLWPAAARNVLAHLIALCDNGTCRAHPAIQPDALFELAR